jgi:hypothetical protein
VQADAPVGTAGGVADTPAAVADVRRRHRWQQRCQRCRVGGIRSSARNTAATGALPVSPHTPYLPFAITDGAGGAAAADAAVNDAGSGVTRRPDTCQNPPNFENVLPPRRRDIRAQFSGQIGVKFPDLPGRYIYIGVARN